jgi:hypothetical protein
MVFGPEATDLPWLGLPAENFFLNLIGKGDALLMCVWRSRDQLARAILATDGDKRIISGCEVAWAKDQPVSIALLEGPGLWHEQALPRELATELRLEWKPPFPAKWRADAALRDGSAESWFDPREFPATDGSGKKGTLGLPKLLMIWPLDGDRMTALDARVVIYPLDRSRATPLTAFCPTDVMRLTLNTGWCQYILDLEGLPLEDNPTPDAVMPGVEKQFERGREKQAAEAIRGRLIAMVEHARKMEGRIGRYLSCARDVEGDTAVVDPKTAPMEMRRLRATAKGLQWAVTEKPGGVARLAELAERVTSLIGKPDAFAECRRAGFEMRRIGAEQDRVLSKCRMLARWLVQQCRMWAARDPAAAERANAVRGRVEKVLQGK